MIDSCVSIVETDDDTTANTFLCINKNVRL